MEAENAMQEEKPPASPSVAAVSPDDASKKLAETGSKILVMEAVSPDGTVKVTKKKTPASTKSEAAKEDDATSKKAKSSSTTSKKTYLVMVHEAIVALKDRSGSSQVAITKYIMSQYKHLQEVPPQVFRSRLGLALKSGVKSGRFVKVKASFKVNSEWTKKQKNLERKRNRKRQEDAKKQKAKREEELVKKRAADREKQRKLLLAKAHDTTNDLTDQERHALKEKLRKQEEARLAKERAERLKKEIAERIKKRRFPMEDTKLHLEDKELGVKPPAAVKRRPVLPSLFACTTPPTTPRRNLQPFSFASKSDDGHGLVSDMMQVYHFFCGDVGFGLNQNAVPEFTMLHLIHATQEVLLGNSKKTRSVPPLISHLFVTALQWLLSSNNDNSKKDLAQLEKGLGPASWGEVCFQYMDAMERYYTTGGSDDKNVEPGSQINVEYLFGLTDEHEIKSDDDEKKVPTGASYLGDAKSALCRAFVKLETKDPWNLTAEELMALLRALTDDVLATRPEISADIAQRDEQMYELLKAKRSADSQFRKIRLAYEGPKRPNRTKPNNNNDGDEKSGENEKSEGRKSLDSQGSETKVSDQEEAKFKPTASKRQFDAATKAQIKANDAYEKGLRKLVARREPVGYDRNFNAVYFFNHDPSMLYVEVLKTPPKNSNDNPVEYVPRKSSWHVIETKSLFDQFVESLDLRGKRENDLYEELMGPSGGSYSLRRFLFDDIKEKSEKAGRIKELEELRRRLANARIFCAAEEEEGGRRSGRLATRAQIELSEVELEIEKVERRIKEDKLPKVVDHVEMTGLEALRKFDNAGRRETRRMREEAQTNQLKPMPCSILWSTGNIDGTGIVGSTVSKMLELEEFCESLSPWERANGGRSAWISSLEDLVHAWNSASPNLLGPPSKPKSEGDILARLPGTPDSGSKRSATDHSPRSEEKRRRLDSPASFSSVTVANQSVPQILASLKPLLLELEERVFEVTGLAMQTREADEADDNMSVATNEDDEDDDNDQDREKVAWKKKIYSLVSIPTSRYGQIREVLVEAIAAARKAHLSSVVAELRSALLLHHPNAAGECKSAALQTLARHGGYDPEDDESGDDSGAEEDPKEDKDEEANDESLLSGEAMMITGSLKGDKNANRVDWVDGVKECKTISRFAALVFAFVKNAEELLNKIQGEEEALYDALKKWEKEEERLKRSRGAKASNKNPPKTSFVTSTEVWTNVRYTDKFCMAKVENSPSWPAKHCEPKDPKLAESLQSVQRVLVSMMGEDGLRVVKTEDISEFTGKPIETDLSEYSKEMRTLLNECLAMARRIVRGRSKGAKSEVDATGCVEEKKSAI